MAGDTDFENSWRRALRMEESVALAEISNLEAVAFDQTRITGDEPIVVMLFAKPSFRLALVGWRTFYLVWDLADYRASMQTAHALSAKPYREAREEWLQWDRSKEQEPHGEMGGLFLPPARQSVLAVQRGTANARLIDLALAASAYRIQYGRYPTKAEDLVPAFIPAIPQNAGC
jgi:hypothetical protein